MPIFTKFVQFLDDREEMNKLESLTGDVWKYFKQIMQVPRESKHEERMTTFLVDFAKEHSLQYKKDSVGNVIIAKPATSPNYGNKTLVLQAHIDMVCVKRPGVEHDFAKDAIKARIETDADGRRWLRSCGTTLGADDGIGVALELAVLAADDIEHGPIECLFTVDEETGLTGAMNLEKDFITGDTLINLDSEDEGEIFVGCAGGCTTRATLEVKTDPAAEGRLGLRIGVKGLLGGHSGSDIHLGRGNALKIMARMVKRLADENGFRLARFEGGRVHNAIPSESEAVGSVPFAERERVRVEFNVFAAELENELREVDPGLRLEMETCETPRELFTADFQQKLINIILACPHGVMSMSQTITGLVQTSTNLAKVTQNDNEITIATSQRSSVMSEKQMMQESVEAVFRLAGARVTVNDGYPAWQPNFESSILNEASSTYEKLFGTKAVIKAIHAGLECGLFLERNPKLDMISVGPTLHNVHTPDECVDIESVDRFWRFLVEIVKNFNRKE